MDGLNSDFILGTDAIDSLFEEDYTGVAEKTPDTENNEENTKETKEETTEVNVDTLFDDEPESVGGEDYQEKEDTASSKDNGTSPSIYSSIAKDLKEDGVFLDLDDEAIASIKDSESFYKAIEEHIQSRMDERSKRIDNALNYNVEPSEIQKYEHALNYLDSIGNDALEDEGDEGEKIRKALIYQDFINRGFSKDRALRETEKSFSAGTDIEDAKEALKGNREYINAEYDKLVQAAKDEEDAFIKARAAQAEELKKSIFDEKTHLGELTLDKGTRQKIYDNLSKPVYKDPNTGTMLTAIQKYESENRVDFLRNLGIIFTLTDGFKNLDNLVKDKVKKEVRKGHRELEHVVNSTSRHNDGSLKFTSGVSDKESRITKFELAI